MLNSTFSKLSVIGAHALFVLTLAAVSILAAYPTPATLPAPLSSTPTATPWTVGLDFDSDQLSQPQAMKAVADPVASGANRSGAMAATDSNSAPD